MIENQKVIHVGVFNMIEQITILVRVCFIGRKFTTSSGKQVFEYRYADMLLLRNRCVSLFRVHEARASIKHITRIHDVFIPIEYRRN